MMLCKLSAVLAFLVLSSALPLSSPENEVSAGLGALNVTALTVNSGPARESQIVLGNGENAFTIALTADGSFVIRHREQPSFTVGPDGDVLVNGMLKSSGTVRLDGTLNFMGVNQWLLAVAEDFTQSSGWSNSTTSVCGSTKNMLGGYGHFAGGDVTKTFRQLPEHSEIRLKASFNFIDAWKGETAYAKLDHQVVWTDMHDHMTSKHGINICGSATAESKFGVPVDVIIPHTSASLSVTFGTTLASNAEEASWGLSDVQIYVR